MNRVRLQVYRRDDGDWGIRLVAGNGQKLAAFVGYARRSSAKRAAVALRRLATVAVVECID